MPGCNGHLRFLAAFGWCRNDEVYGRRLAIMFSESFMLVGASTIANENGRLLSTRAFGGKSGASCLVVAVT